MARRIAAALASAARPLVVSGSGGGSEEIVRAAANVATALAKTGRVPALSLTLPECNSLGLALLEPRNPETIFGEAAQSPPETIIVLENDLFRRAAEGRVAAVLQRARQVIVIDHLLHATAKAASVVFPAATFAESGGTLISAEGRAQRLYPVLAPSGEVRASRLWVEDLMEISGQPRPWRSGDELRAALAAEVPALRGVVDCAPPADFRLLGLKIPRQTHRASGRTALPAHAGMQEPRPPEDPESPFAYSLEGYPGQPPPALINRYWSPGWNSVQAAAAVQDGAGGPLRGGDPGARLLEPRPPGEGGYFAEVAAPFAARVGQWYTVPLPHQFGSEELSALAPGIAQLSPHPFLAVHPAELRARGFAPGQQVTIVFQGVRCRLPLRSDPSLPPGMAAAPVGVPGMPWLDLPAWGTWERVPA